VFDEEPGQAHDSPHSNKTDDLAQKIENPQLSPVTQNVQQQHKKKRYIMLSKICPTDIKKARRRKNLHRTQNIL